MKIRCTIERKGGTEVTLGEKTYHFCPNDSDQHVAEVDDPAHVKRLLAIPEAYEPAELTQPKALRAAAGGVRPTKTVSTRG